VQGIRYMPQTYESKSVTAHEQKKLPGITIDSWGGGLPMDHHSLRNPITYSPSSCCSHFVDYSEFAWSKRQRQSALILCRRRLLMKNCPFCKIRGSRLTRVAAGGWLLVERTRHIPARNLLQLVYGMSCSDFLQVAVTCSDLQHHLLRDPITYSPTSIL